MIARLLFGHQPARHPNLLLGAVIVLALAADGIGNLVCAVLGLP